MSLFTDKGYTENTKFRCLKDWEAFEKGEIVTISRDDGSRCPWFINSKGQEHCMFLPDESEVKDLEVFKEEEKVMTFELKAGDKVEVINSGIFKKGMVKVGDVATYKGSMTFSCPTWDDTQLCSKDFWSKYLKPYVAAKPKTPFEAAGYTSDMKFKITGNEDLCWHDFPSGTIVELFHADESLSPKFKDVNSGKTLYVGLGDIELLTAPLTFPCCVPMSEIKDQETFDKIFALFIANGAEKYETDWEDNKDYGYNYFGVDYNKDTLFYGCFESYSFNGDEDEVTTYSVAELLSLVAKEDAIVTPVTTLTTQFPVGTEVQIAKDSEWYYGDEFSSNPKDVKGTITSNTHSHDTDGFVYYVKWSNGTSNSYKLNDLVLWNEGWIEWNGKSSCPVLEGTKIDAKFRNGDVELGKSPEGYRWNHINDRDIVAYRLHTPVTPSVASQEAITERLEDNPSVGIDLSKEASGEPVYPKVGDMIKIIDNERYHSFKIGETVTVVEDCSDEDTPNWRCSNKEDLSYVCSGWVYIGEFELVKEVEETPQYKVGDWVKVVDAGSSCFSVGDIARIAVDYSHEHIPNWCLARPEEYPKRASQGWVVAKRIEPYTPPTVSVQSEVKETPLVSIVKDVTYHVSIKGTLFTFTQDEINELTEELLGFSDDF